MKRARIGSRGRRTVILLAILTVATTLPTVVTAVQRRPARATASPVNRQPAEPAPAQPAPPPATPTTSQSSTDTGTPTEDSLGFPIYPNAQFLTSYDAGRGQRYYLFGSNSSFADMVQYYSVVLDERGDRVFDAPPTHIFEIGRFREESMAFPPGVTIKDYVWNGSEGYLNPTLGAELERFRTIIQIVPAPVVPPR